MSTSITQLKQEHNAACYQIRETILKSEGFYTIAGAVDKVEAIFDQITAPVISQDERVLEQLLRITKYDGFTPPEVRLEAIKLYYTLKGKLN